MIQKEKRRIDKLDSLLKEIAAIRKILASLRLDEVVPDTIRRQVNNCRDKVRKELNEIGLEAEAEGLAQVAHQVEHINSQQLDNVLAAMEARLEKIIRKLKKPEELVKKLMGYISELEITIHDLKNSHASTSLPEWEKMKLWKRRLCNSLRKSNLPVEADELEKKSMKSIDVPARFAYLLEMTYLPYLNELVQRIIEDPEEIFALQQATTQQTLSKSSIPTGNKVFIVHGHDEANLLKLETLLKDELHLEPVILFKKAGRGRFLLTKFEEEAKNARFAFILMTPDDKVTTSKGKEYFQARPNVFFELGWFCNYLGQQNVCIIIKEGTEIHSDFGGVEIIWFKESVEDKFLKIKEELRAAKLIE